MRENAHQKQKWCQSELFGFGAIESKHARQNTKLSLTSTANSPQSLIEYNCNNLDIKKLIKFTERNAGPEMLKMLLTLDYRKYKESTGRHWED